MWSAMMNFVRKNEIWVFFFLIILSNTAFIWAIDVGLLPEGAFNMGRFALLGGVLFGLIFVLRGFGGIIDLLRPMLVWRVAPVWYLVAIVWAIANMVLFLMGKGVVTGNGLAEIRTNFGIVTRPSVMVTILISSFIGEIVWISYAVRKLSQTHTVYIAAMITGLVWTLWWVPMVYFEIGVIPGLPILAMLINQTGVAAVAAFLYWHSRSGLIVLIAQILFNGALLVFPVAPTTGGVPAYYAFASMFFVSALALFLVAGPKPIFRSAAQVKTS